MSNDEFGVLLPLLLWLFSDGANSYDGGPFDKARRKRNKSHSPKTSTRTYVFLFY